MKMRAAASRLIGACLGEQRAHALGGLWRARACAAAGWRWRRSRTSAARPAATARARNPPICSSSPPMKKPAPLVAFFEPVNQATQWNNCPAPCCVLALMALFEAVLVRSLATPAMPCASTTQVTDAAALQAGSSADSISNPPICSAMPTASMRGMPKRKASQPPPRLAKIPAASYSRNRNASMNGV